MEKIKILSLFAVPPLLLLVLFPCQGFAKDVPLGESFRGVLPFLLSDFIRVSLLVAFSGISLWLMRLWG